MSISTFGHNVTMRAAKENWKSSELLEEALKLEVEGKAKVPSQTCSCCGHIAKENRLEQVKFVCTACGNALNAAGTVAKAS